MDSTAVFRRDDGFLTRPIVHLTVAHVNSPANLGGAVLFGTATGGNPEDQENVDNCTRCP